ncbi:MAG TPA: hypothetical protein VFT72_10290 [Opitutaceae bacterium]|nr:hypothetical protein [Opitutaceae bacterium]
MENPQTTTDGAIEVRDILNRLRLGAFQIIGLTCLGFVLGAVILVCSTSRSSVFTSTRVTFSFPGLAKGLYPDKSKFNPDDLRAPDVVLDALNRLNVSNADRILGTIRSGVSVQGIIPDEVVRQRDRMRASGQTPPVYIPDEYYVTLSVSRSMSLGDHERSQLLGEIINVYREKFQRTYGAAPLEFGNAFEILRDADYPEYELVLTDEIQKVQAYLEEQLKSDEAKSFRSQRTNLSYSDLQNQTSIFARIHLNEALGLISLNGLSKNRKTAMIKLDYHLQTVKDQQQKALKEQSVVDDLLAKAQEKSSGYVMGIKSQATQGRPETPFIDQGLIDSLLANDSYGLLLRRALDAGTRVKALEAEEDRLIERRQRLATFLNGAAVDEQSIADANHSLENLEKRYEQLVTRIRDTDNEFRHQQFADAIRVSAGFTNSGIAKVLTIYALVGAILGAAFGVALSFLDLRISAKKLPIST